MSSDFQYFEIDQNNNDSRDIKGIILNNGIKMVLISDKKIIKSCCSVGVGIGSLHDTHEGIAHFLEHLLFMGSEKFKNQNDYHSYVKNSGGYDNAFTSDEETCYFLVLESKFLKKGIEMLSWFFRAPLLKESHIESERNIVDSEHEKNILSDLWIEDDLSKYFIKEDNKYRRFSTGNNESLKNVKQEDAYDFYKKYYTTDNICICIVDSKDIDSMINDYANFFGEIKKTNHKKEKLDTIEFIDDDLIIYKSISNYSTVDVRIVFEIDKHDKEDTSIFNFLSFILFTKFENSPIYHLLKNEYINDVNVEASTLYEKYSSITLELFYTKDEDIVNKIKKSLDIINNYLNVIENLNDKEFNVLYESYANIVKINSYFDKIKDVSDLAISVTTNMLSSKNKDELSDSVMKNEIMADYNNKLILKYKNIIKGRQLKIISNINILDMNEKKYSVSKWYNAKYYLNKINKFYEYDNKKFASNLKTFKTQFKFDNLLSISYHDSEKLLKLFKNEKKIKSNLVPKLIYNNDKVKRKIYLVRGNAFDSPLSGVAVVRNNNNYSVESNSIYIIYNGIISKLLMYYLEIESHYLSNFSLNLSDNSMMYIFRGIFNLNKNIKHIMDFISYDNIINNEEFENAFNSSIEIFVQNLENDKYNSPFTICQKYLDVSINNELTECEILKYIKNLNITEFKKELFELLKYEDEEILIYANTILKSKSLISDIDNSVHINEKLLIKKIERQKSNFNKNNYLIPKDFFTPGETNNCLLDCYVLKEIKLNYENKNMTKKSFISYITYMLISEFLVGLLTDKLFDKLRTVEKLGYIVRVSSNITTKGESLLMQLYYIVQSKFSIDRITASIKEFNKNLVKNTDFKENFENLKQNKINLLNKDFESFSQEMSFLTTNMMLGIQNYDIKNILIEICTKIKYSDIKDILKKISSMDNIKIIIDTKK
jgi:secreted Zn-dependent insulinase-like peptidase